jgi:hypothetical protein
MRQSRQFNFFIHPDDWNDILSFNKSQDVIMIESDTGVNGLPKLAGKDFKFQIFLTKQEFMDKGLIKFKTGYNYVDVLRSYVIEFGTGGFYANADKILNRARLYCNMSYWEDDTLIEKGKEFSNWTNQYFNQFKKIFLKENEFDKEFKMSINTITWARINKAKVTDSGLQLVSNK